MERTRDPSVGRVRDSSLGRIIDSSLGGRRDGSAGRMRDSSVGRFRERGLPMGNLGNPVQEISGPIIKVGKRFESEEEAKKARERLYKEGLAGALVHDPNSKEIDAEGASPESEHSGTTDEMWPGNY